PADSKPELSALARQNLSYLNELNRATLPVLGAGTLETYLSDLNLRGNELRALSQRFAGTPYAALAKIEAEQADLDRIMLLFHNRYVLPGGLVQALREPRAVVERHADSTRAPRHRFMLADFHSIAAHDMVETTPPERAGFDGEAFDALTGAAREIYFDL